MRQTTIHMTWKLLEGSMGDLKRFILQDESNKERRKKKATEKINDNYERSRKSIKDKKAKMRGEENIFGSRKEANIIRIAIDRRFQKGGK